MTTMKTLLLFCSVISLMFPNGVQGISCPEGMILSTCVTCWNYCPKPKTEVCSDRCKTDCVCSLQGYVIGPNNKCILKETCPKVN